jgi:hypothetical protein
MKPHAMCLASLLLSGPSWPSPLEMPAPSRRDREGGFAGEGSISLKRRGLFPRVFEDFLELALVAPERWLGIRRHDSNYLVR